MDGRSGDADRKNPVREMSRAIARGASQVLQRKLRGDFLSGRSSDQACAGRPGDTAGDPSGLTAWCEECQAPLPPNARTHRRFCNARCRDRNRYQIERAARAEARCGRSCPMCGIAIDDARPLNAKFCSSLCGGRAKEAWHRRRRIKTCARCGDQFNAHKDYQRFCCVRCAKPQPSPVCCNYCSVEFIPKHGARFCSRSCARRAQWRAGRAMPNRLFRLSAKRFDATWGDKCSPGVPPVAKLERPARRQVYSK